MTKYFIDAEVVDTYGGDYTYRDVWGEYENGKWTFYQRYYGAKPSDTEEITNKDEIKEYLTIAKIFKYD